jgi:hypothetical protein
MHHLYVESVIIYSQHSDISIMAGVALHLAHFSLYNNLSLFIYTVRKPRFFYNFFTKQKQKQTYKHKYLQQLVKLPVATLQRQNTEMSKQIFPEKEYRGLIFSNFHIQVSVRDLYIPTIGLPILLEEICRPILRPYKSLTDK